MRVKIGTRGSDLALWQARTVAAALCAAGAADVEIVVLATRGDAIDDVALSTIEGKSFFTAEIERALLDGAVDVAVHSHKDLATESPPGLAVCAVPARGPAEERLLALPPFFDAEAPFLPIAQGAAVGTSAPRRAEQLRELRPDLEVLNLRGNVPTRVAKLRAGQYAAIVLASAGLERLALDLAGLAVHTLPIGLFTPAPAQGALAVQVRAGDAALRELVRRALDDPESARIAAAERSVLRAAGGGCSLPLGAVIARAPGGYEARAFLGREHPRPGLPARWARARAATPEAAAERVLAALVEGGPTGFGPFEGLRVALAGSDAEAGSSELAERLTTLGAEVVFEPVITFEDLPAPELARELAALRPGDVLALTSRRAALRLAGARAPAGVCIGAVGPATARALAEAGLAAQVVGSGGAAELARALPIEPGATALFPCAAEPHGELVPLLEARGARVRAVPLYRTHAAPDAAGRSDVDVRIYTSPSAVRALSAWEHAREAETAGGAARCLRSALGTATWEALCAAGLGEPSAWKPAGSGVAAAIARLARLAREPAGAELPTGDGETR